MRARARRSLQGKAAISLRYLSDIGGRCQGDIGDIHIDPARRGEGGLLLPVTIMYMSE